LTKNYQLSTSIENVQWEWSCTLLVIEIINGVWGEATICQRQKGLGAEHSALSDFWDLLPKECILGMFHLKFCLKLLETCSLLRLYS